MTRAQTLLPRPRRLRGALVALSALSCWAASASAGVSVVQTNATAAFAQPANGRTPARVFFTDLGVYELDTAAKAVRIWQRSDDGLELLLPQDGSAAMRPYTEAQYQYTTPRPQRFTGVDAAGDGTTFNYPAGMDKHPTADKFAVVSGGEYLETKLTKNIPSVQVYSFSETAGGDGSLGSLEISLEDEFREAFFTTETGWEQVFLGYTNIVTVTMSNVILGASSNWVYVVSADPLVTQTNDWDSALLEEHNPPPEIVYFPDERGIIPEDGMEYPIFVERTWTVATTNVETRPLYGYRPSNVTTNASYLSSATDVAFLGDAAIVVPISDCGYSIVYNDKQWDTDHWVTNVYEVSGFVVFDAADPSKKGLVFPCATNLPGKIAGICADTNGAIYAAVPSAAAVYRFSSPGGSPASWLSLPDRTVVTQDLDFVVGVPSMPSSLFGCLSNPDDVALWKPDAGSPILLVADRNNDRVEAFDPASTWTVTNWLGMGFVAKLAADGLPEDPSLGYVVSDTGTTVLTNWYRVEETAFPLFAVAPSANPMNKPEGVFGRDGEPVLAVADHAGGDVRLYAVDLSALDSEDILSFAAFWPGRAPGFPEVSSRDFAVTTNESGAVIARWDAPHANQAATPFFTVMESDAGSNVLEFAVEPSRFDRTYALSVSPADDVVTVLSGTAVVPAGATSGSFSFLAKDGVVFEETEIVYWETNSAPDGTVVQTRTDTWSDSVAFAETNVWRVSPLYVATVSGEGGYSTNIAFVVGNEAPTFVEATYYGYVIPGNPVFGTPPELYVFGLGATAEDVAADADLRYLWWATSDANWAATNLQWAVTNDSWAAGATPEWTPFAGEGTPDDFCVARGLGVPFPFDYNVPNGPYVGYAGLAPGASWGTAPFVVVCTVIDKDGGFSIVTYPQKTVSAGYDTDWTWSGMDEYSMTSGIPDGHVDSDAVYAARFIAVSGTDVTFVVWPASGTPGASDTVTLQASSTLDGASEAGSANWSALRQFPVGRMALPATNNFAPPGSVPVRFYRVVQP